MQSQFQNFGDVNEALKKMRGIEFVVSQQKAPDLFVISKQQRESYDDARIVKMYFIANGNIYLAPDTYSIISSRMLNINQSLKAAIDTLTKSVQFSPSKGYTYAAASESAVNENERVDEEDGATRAARAAETRSMHKALFNTLERSSSS